MPDDGATLLDRPAVRRVRDALGAAGSAAVVIALGETARTAADAASALRCPLGAIVKSLVFRVGERPVLALVAGDRRCDSPVLAAVLGLEGLVARADAEQVRAATGQAIGGVAPLGHAERLPTAIDASLARFDRIFAAAGHPHCVFGTSIEELGRLTGGVVDAGVGAPL
jgi:prolyl-tRNA editing enzyme YbaK/EbsC (Cys-tRNA(Pro) deacylase)